MKKDQLRSLLVAYADSHDIVFESDKYTEFWLHSVSKRYREEISHLPIRDFGPDHLDTVITPVLEMEVGGEQFIEKHPTTHRHWWEAVREISKTEPEQAASTFSNLFDSSNSLAMRLRQFEEFFKPRINELGEDRHKLPASMSPSKFYGIPTLLLELTFPASYVAYKYRATKHFFDKYSDFQMLNAGRRDVVEQYTTLLEGYQSVREELTRFCPEADMHDVHAIIYNRRELLRIVSNEGVNTESPSGQVETQDGDQQTTNSPDSAADHEIDLTVESIADYSSILEPEDVESTLENLRSDGAKRKEALKYIYQYTVDMEEDSGLYAISGLGVLTGYHLAQYGITSRDDLLECSLDDLKNIDKIPDFRAENIYEELQASDVSDTASNSTFESAESAKTDSLSTNNGDSGTGTSSPVSDPDDLQPVIYGGTEIVPNPLSEYYESIRSVKKVLQTTLKMEGTEIAPDDFAHPAVQYFAVLDALIGYGKTDRSFTGYGLQHQDRLSVSIDDYRGAFGDGNWITDYRAISVEPYSNETQDWLDKHTWLKDPQRFVRPVAPMSEDPLPEMVTSADELIYALELLDQFPAYPLVPNEPIKTEDTVPVVSLYKELFAELPNDHRVDVDTLSGPGQAGGDPITGPVADATPTSQGDAESLLLDYGKLTHLFDRITPPGNAPIQQPLPVFALDWYRQRSSSFNELQALAKFNSDEPTDHFRPRLRDMIYRRFLSDRWNYDYITVFPGHEAGSLSPQLVELARDAVFETSIIYTPLLERTETTTRQREKDQDKRVEVALNPSETLQVQANLNGETVILLDDICTTGSSMLAGAYLLREAGASRVIGLALGLTPGGSEDTVKEIAKPDAFASEIIAGVE